MSTTKSFNTKQILNTRFNNTTQLAGVSGNSSNKQATARIERYEQYSTRHTHD